MKYDLSKIFPDEFEGLINDLLAATWGVHVENFKQGKDKGIDGRYIDSGGNLVIIQAKHYAKSGFSALKSQIKNVELEKIRHLKPSKYCLATSVELSPAQKQDLFDICVGFIKNKSDIYGADDINAMLIKNTEVVKHYYHLWLPQSPILEEVIKSIQNNDIYNVTCDVINSSREQASYYHRTSDYNKAFNILEEKQVLLIHGIAGVGKTSLAQQLFLEFITKDFDPIAVLNNVLEFNRVYEAGKKQIFFLDDCWGSNFANALMERKDAHIVKFIERIQNDKNKRLILTSRTNIQDDVFSRAESLYVSQLKSREYSIILQDYTLDEKARILYNFLWRSEIAVDFLKVFIDDKLYDTIIKHKSYNPRLLEFITKKDGIEADTPLEYKEYILRNLNNSKKIFKNSYQIELTDLSRVILDLVVLCGGVVFENDIELAFENWKDANKFTAYDFPTGFKDTIEGMLRSFITRTIDINSKVRYSVFNPSISDMVIERYFGENRKIEYIKYLRCVEQSSALLFLASISKKYSEFSHAIIIAYLSETIDKILNKGIMFNGFIQCINVLEFDDKLKVMTKDRFIIFENMTDFGSEVLDIDALIGMYIIFSDFYMSNSSIKINFFSKALEKITEPNNYPLEALKKISDFLKDSEILHEFEQSQNYDNFIKKYHDALIIHWNNYIDDFAESNVKECIEIVSYAYNDEHDYDEPEYDFNEKKIIELMLKEFDELYINIDSYDAQKILSSINWENYLDLGSDENYKEYRDTNSNLDKYSYNEEIFTNIIRDKYI